MDRKLLIVKSRISLFILLSIFIILFVGNLLYEKNSKKAQCLDFSIFFEGYYSEKYPFSPGTFPGYASEKQRKIIEQGSLQFYSTDSFRIKRPLGEFPSIVNHFNTKTELWLMDEFFYYIWDMQTNRITKVFRNMDFVYKQELGNLYVQEIVQTPKGDIFGIGAIQLDNGFLQLTISKFSRETNEFTLYSIKDVNVRTYQDSSLLSAREIIPAQYWGNNKILFAIKNAGLFYVDLQTGEIQLVKALDNFYSIDMEVDERNMLIYLLKLNLETYRNGPELLLKKGDIIQIDWKNNQLKEVVIPNGQIPLSYTGLS